MLVQLRVGRFKVPVHSSLKHFVAISRKPVECWEVVSAHIPASCPKFKCQPLDGQDDSVRKKLFQRDSSGLLSLRL